MSVSGAQLPKSATIGAGAPPLAFSIGQWSGGRDLPVHDSFARSQVIAEWHGQVVSIESAYFVAQLKGKLGTGVTGSLEEAQIPLDEVRSDDLLLLKAGAFFRLCVNLELINGSKRRVTDLVFRRMPGYRRDELEAAKESADQLFHALRVE